MKKTHRSLSPIERVVDSVLAATIEYGALKVVYPSGAKRSYGAHKPSVTLGIMHMPVARLRNPALFMGEAYMFGEILINEDELDAFFQIVSQNPVKTASLGLLQKLPKREQNTYKRQTRQIAHHYDIGNDYYRLWLDKTLTYSCAYYKKKSDSLELAQRQKIDHILSKLQLTPGCTLLDIGCGWGHLSVRAAQQYGARVFGVTLSEEQLKGATKLAKDNGVDHLIEFKLMNYQDISDSRIFDRVVSVGMFEHVGRHNQDAYFSKVKQLLHPDGVSVLHTITDRLDRKLSPWIDKYIFPGGHLPTVAHIEKQMALHGLWSIDREDLWQHYALTLDEWRARHRKNKQAIITMHDETFYRMQDFWLAGSSAAFRHGDNGLNQFIFTHAKPKDGRWPLTRTYIYDKA